MWPEYSNCISFINFFPVFAKTTSVPNFALYFIPSSEFNAYLKQIKVILSAVKKHRIFSLVMNTIYIFLLEQIEAVSTM